MQIFKDRSIQYSSFDILSDEDVRQGLKTYSNWPTYPQVYVNGELIGGLDIIKVRPVYRSELQKTLVRFLDGYYSAYTFLKSHLYKYYSAVWTESSVLLGMYLMRQ